MSDPFTSVPGAAIVSEVGVNNKSGLGIKRPVREETFVKSERIQVESSNMSSLGHPVEGSGQPSDILTTDIHSSNKTNTAFNNQNAPEPSIESVLSESKTETNTSTATLNPVITTSANKNLTSTTSTAMATTSSQLSEKAAPPAEVQEHTKVTEAPVPARRGGSMAFTIDLGDDAPTRPAAMSATAFTVDMGGEELGGGGGASGKKMAQTDSLSNFLPQKLRKSFKDRASKVKSEKDEKQANEV